MTTAAMELASRRRNEAASPRSRLETLRGILAAFRRYRETRRAINDLRAMSDWQLRDIGIHRSEIASVATGADDRHRRGATSGPRAE